MWTFTGRCLCEQSHFTVDVEVLNVYAYHYALCQKWSGDITMYLEAGTHPLMSPESAEPSYFPSSSRGERFFCSGCGCLLRFTLMDSGRYFISWTPLEFNEVDRHRLILAAEIYTETQPALWRLTGQYVRLSGEEVEGMDYPRHLAHQLLMLYLCQTELHSYR